MIEHGYASSLEHAAELTVKAGSDMDMESYAYVKHLVDLVKAGRVDESMVDDAVRRILRVKFELGLFDDPYKYCNEKREKEMIYHPEHIAAALDMAKKSIVLLKNEEATLPLKKSHKIAVIGDLADDKDSPLGNWRMAADDNTAVSVLEGLDAYGVNYTYAEGAKLVTGPTAFSQELTVNTTDRSGFKQALKAAREAEVVVMVLGEHGLHSGEARSRANLGLPGVQQELLEAVYKVNTNIVLVLMNGRPLTITWADEHVPAIVEAWQLGSQTGHAVAQVLFGDYNPSGKLPMTFPRHVGQVPIYYNQFRTGRPGPRNEVFWPHYMDESEKPLYPFGYGLSYTQFQYTDLEVAVKSKHQVEVTVKVTNIGDRAGEEVVQLYLHDKVASVVRPVKELKGFEKIKLEPEQTIKVVFKLTEKEMGFYNGMGDYLMEPGEFEVMVGCNSEEGLRDVFVIE
jgi:beta-glucosidase